MHQLSELAVPGAIARAATPEALFAAVRADDAARALVTFYDDATGERMELSAASLGNWIAKTHFLLTDELGLGPGDRAYVDLPLHWQRLVVWFGVWSAGLEVVSRPVDASVGFVGPDGVAVARAVDPVFALALAPWGRGFEGAAPMPDGAQDFVVAVRPQADAWGTVRSVAAADDPAFDAMSRRDLVTAAREFAHEQGWSTGARVAVFDTARADRPEAVLGALSVRGSLLLSRGTAASDDPELMTRRRLQERVTHQL